MKNSYTFNFCGINECCRLCNGDECRGYGMCPILRAKAEKYSAENGALEVAVLKTKDADLVDACILDEFRASYPEEVREPLFVFDFTEFEYEEDCHEEFTMYSKVSVDYTIGQIYGFNLEAIVMTLRNYAEQDQKVYINFRGFRLKSDNPHDLDEDCVYKTFTGYTMKEYRQRVKDLNNQLDQMFEDGRDFKTEILPFAEYISDNILPEKLPEEDIIEAKKPEWIKHGYRLIDSSKKDLWEKCVKVRSEDLYAGNDLDDALTIMDMLDQGCSISDAYRKLDDQNQSGFSYSIVKSIVRDFSKRGKEFANFRK